MKKLLAIALIATSFVACNDAETKTEEKAADSTVVPVTIDTAKPAPVVVDTTKPAVADTTKK